MPMTDNEYIEYAKAVHKDIYTLSTPMIDGIANKVLTRIRREQPNLLELKETWTACQSTKVDVIDVLSVLAIKDVPFAKMHQELGTILERYIIDRFNEIDPKSHLLVRYRYIGEFGLVDEVKECIYGNLKEHYATKYMSNLLERYPDLNEVSPR